MRYYEPEEYKYYTIEEIADILNLNGSNKSIGKRLVELGFKKKRIKGIYKYYHQFNNYD